MVAAGTGGETQVASKEGYRVVALEEHYFDPEIAARFDPKARFGGTRIRELLDDLEETRIADMNAAGIDVQVLSQGAPGVQRFPPEDAVALARGANDRLAETIRRRPDRYAGFATLPTPDPRGAADELDRAVSELGFKGGMVHGLTNGRFIDDRDFWPLFERAEALDVPIYLHPSLPHPDVTKAYYADYLGRFPSLLTAGWGFTVETATQGIRMVLSGVFDAHPGLQVILGHLGEGLPFLLWRIDDSLARDCDFPFRETFCAHVHVTTSGFFSDPALVCSMMELGSDRIMFSVDYPFAENRAGADWMEGMSISPGDKRKILAGNAERLLKL